MNKAISVFGLCVSFVTLANAGGFSDHSFRHVPPKPLAASHSQDQRPLSLNEGPYHTATFYPGSLRNRITQLASIYGWSDVIWLPSHDYNWRGVAHFNHQSIFSVLSVVLKGYPLQAQFYDGNHILVIANRNL